MKRQVNVHYKEQLEKNQQLAIQHMKQNLDDKKQELQTYKRAFAKADTEQEQKTLQFRMEHTQRVIIKIQNELQKKGVVEKEVDQKESGTTYKEQRKKFTAHLQLSTLEYLQQLKTNGSISNISAFLDELVAEHQKEQ